MAKIDDKVAYLDDERKKLWAKLLAMKKNSSLLTMICNLLKPR